MVAQCVVDIQCFRIGEERGKIQWVVKELAVYDGNVSSHWIFKAPFPFHYLSENLRKEAIWNINNHHGLPWHEGAESPEDFPAFLDASTKHAEIIYVKGRQKAMFIRQFLKHKPVVELMEHPKLKPVVPECWHHKLQYCACALANAISLYNTYFPVSS